MARFRRRGYGRLRRFKRRGSRYGRRRTYRRKGYGRSSLLRKKIQSVVSRNIETKEYNFTTTSVWGNITATWGEVALGIDSISQGIGQVQYIGKSIFIKRVMLWGWLRGAQSIDHAADDPYNFVRIVIARWSGDSPAYPLTTIGAVMDTRINKNVNPEFRSIQKKYCDRMILLKPNSVSKLEAAVSYSFAMKFFKKKITFKGRGLRVDRIFPHSRIVISMLSNAPTANYPGFVSGHVIMQYKDA